MGKREQIQQKRRLGNHPRIPFTKFQLATLEERFRQDPYLSSFEVSNLSTMLQISERRVKIWFQNRRAKQRRNFSDHKSAVEMIEKNARNRKGVKLNDSHCAWNHQLININKCHN